MQSLYESQDFIDCHDEFRSAFFKAQLQFQVTTDKDVHAIAGTHHHTKDIGLVRGGHDTPFVRFVAVPGVLLTALGLYPEEFTDVTELLRRTKFDACGEIYEDEDDIQDDQTEVELADLEADMADLKSQMRLMVDRLENPVGADGKRRRTE